MSRERESGLHLLPILITGFALLVILLGASAFFVFGLLRTVEADARRTVEQQTAAAQLLNNVQTEEDSLSAVFYELAAHRDRVRSGILQQRLETLGEAIQKNTDIGMSLHNAAEWRNVRQKAEAFIAAGKTMLETNTPPPELFLRAHQEVIDAMAELATSTFAATSATERSEFERNSELIHRSLLLLGCAIMLAIAGACLTVYAANGMFRRLRWQASELALLSSRTMSDQEELARRFSRELHDHLGQTLSALEANLVAMSQAESYDPARMEDCFVILKDAVDHVREFSQLLRPSILDDFGINASLLWLGQKFSERTGIAFEFVAPFEGRLPEQTETQLFRIAQEALTNVARHSRATSVEMNLSAVGDQIRLAISDNGKGFSPPLRENALGLAGMRARALTAHGTVTINSSASLGVTVVAEVPMTEKDG